MRRNNDTAGSVPYRGNRRRFLKTTVALASSFAVPQLVPRSVFGAAAPSNRINVGQIGCGHQSQRIVPSFLVHDDVQIVAVCDVNRAGKGYYYPDHVLGRETARRWIDEHYAEKASGGDPKATVYERILGPETARPGAVASTPPKASVSRGKGCDAYNDFRELLARTDIDAVAIVVPDHWHALIAIAAMQAGKDVYCEKPLSLTIYEGQRDGQGGAQAQPHLPDRRPVPLLPGGAPGLRAGAQRTPGRDPPRAAPRVDANSFPSPGPGWQPQPVPEGFDYDFWLGPAPEAPYHIERCFHRWRYILDYSNGQTANFGCHTNDIAQWALGMDGTTPVEFEDNGSEFLPKGSLFTAATKTAFRARYANGDRVDSARRATARRPSSRARKAGWRSASAARLKTFPENLKDSVIGPQRDPPARRAIRPAEANVRKDIDADHVRNFLDAVKSRQGPDRAGGSRPSARPASASWATSRKS